MGYGRIGPPGIFSLAGWYDGEGKIFRKFVSAAVVSMRRRPLPAVHDLTLDGRLSTNDVSVCKKMGEYAQRQFTL